MWKYSAAAAFGVIDRQLKPSGVGVSTNPGSGRPTVFDISPLPSTSASNPRRSEAAAAASEAATVDFPVPPFPDTTRIGRENSSSQFTGAHYRETRDDPLLQSSGAAPQSPRPRSGGLGRAGLSRPAGGGHHGEATSAAGRHRQGP